jgi:hypothetical protein
VAGNRVTGVTVVSTPSECAIDLVTRARRALLLQLAHEQGAEHKSIDALISKNRG